MGREVPATERGDQPGPLAELPWAPARCINILLSQGALECQHHKTQGLSTAGLFLSRVPCLPPRPSPSPCPPASELPCGPGKSLHLTVLPSGLGHGRG